MSVISHPFGSYVPRDAELLVLGSFPPVSLGPEDFFYASKHNQFWKIISRIYGAWLPETWQKKMFCRINKVAMADVIHSTRRIENNSSDENLQIEEYTDIERILQEAPAIKTVACTSRFVKERFEKHFSELIETHELEAVTLPSPSPRYARMSFDDKVAHYERIFKPTFAQKVYTLLLTVPRGYVTTYKAIARKIGTKAYRAVGQVLNKNPYGVSNPVELNTEDCTVDPNRLSPDMVVPCHRVVSHDRSLGGFATGLGRKRRLLEREGIRIDRDGRVSREFILKHL